MLIMITNPLSESPKKAKQLIPQYLKTELFRFSFYYLTP